MNNPRLQAIAQKQQYHILPIRSGMQLELHEKVGDEKNQRIWKFKGLVLKVKRPNHIDGTFTIRGKTSGMTIEKIYPLSFLAFDKVLLLDSFKIRRAKLYFLRDKVGKDARLKSLITSDERGMDLLVLAKESIQVQEEILDTPAEPVGMIESDETFEEDISDTHEESDDLSTQETEEGTEHSEKESEETVAIQEVVNDSVEEVVQETQEEIVAVEEPTQETAEIEPIQEEVEEIPQEETMIEIAESEEMPMEEVATIPEVVEEKATPTQEERDETNSNGDDLILIDGIGEAFKDRLNTLGIVSFADLVALTDERIAELEESDSMTSLEEWHNWIQQAKGRLA